LLSVSLLGGPPSSVQINKDASWVQAKIFASPPHSFTGAPAPYDLELVVDEALGSVALAKFSFKFADFTTGNKKRDKKMWEWMDLEKHPEVAFVLRRTEPVGNGFLAVGDLSLHGVVREVAIPFSLDWKDGDFVLDGTCTIDHRDWDLKKIRMFLFSVNPVLEISIHLEGNHAD
jgi:polyisoprenoid-binding protein YceI